MTVYDQHGFRILFHFAKDALPERPDVLVVVISMLSTAPQPIRNIVFQSAVPKVRQLLGLWSTGSSHEILPLQERQGGCRAVWNGTQLGISFLLESGSSPSI